MSSRWRYHFAMDLFDFVDVRTPQDDYLPNADPGDPGRCHPPASGPRRRAPGQQRPGTNPTLANQGLEDGVGEDGKININTPMARPGDAADAYEQPDGSINVDDKQAACQGDLAYRDFGDRTSGTPRARAVPQHLRVASGAGVRHVEPRDARHAHPLSGRSRTMRTATCTPYNAGTPALGGTPETARRIRFTATSKHPILP